MNKARLSKLLSLTKFDIIVSVLGMDISGNMPTVQAFGGLLPSLYQQLPDRKGQTLLNFIGLCETTLLKNPKDIVTVTALLEVIYDASIPSPYRCRALSAICNVLLNSEDPSVSGYGGTLLFPLVEDLTLPSKIRLNALNALLSREEGQGIPSGWVAHYKSLLCAQDLDEEDLFDLILLFMRKDGVDLLKDELTSAALRITEHPLNRESGCVYCAIKFLWDHVPEKKDLLWDRLVVLMNARFCTLASAELLIQSPFPEHESLVLQVIEGECKSVAYTKEDYSSALRLIKNLSRWEHPQVALCLKPLLDSVSALSQKALIDVTEALFKSAYTQQEAIRYYQKAIEQSEPLQRKLLAHRCSIEKLAGVDSDTLTGSEFDNLMSIALVESITEYFKTNALSLSTQVKESVLRMLTQPHALSNSELAVAVKKGEKLAIPFIMKCDAQTYNHAVGFVNYGNYQAACNRGYASRSRMFRLTSQTIRRKTECESEFSEDLFFNCGFEISESSWKQWVGRYPPFYEVTQGEQKVGNCAWSSCKSLFLMSLFFVLCEENGLDFETENKDWLKLEHVKIESIAKNIFSDWSLWDRMRAHGQYQGHPRALEEMVCKAGFKTTNMAHIRLAKIQVQELVQQKKLIAFDVLQQKYDENLSWVIAKEEEPYALSPGGENFLSLVDGVIEPDTDSESDSMEYETIPFHPLYDGWW
tara:strand:+ start:21612 stop:23711 length:2100 start_codon:yes stop_codon:yes gene_type:complete